MAQNISKIGLVKLDTDKRQSPMVADFSREVFSDEWKDEVRQNYVSARHSSTALNRRATANFGGRELPVFEY